MKHLLLRVALLVVVASAGLIASVSVAAAADESSVVAQLQAERVYFEEGSEAVDGTVIKNAIAKADGCGISLYVAILAEGEESFNAKDLREGVGDGTVALFQPRFYYLASNDIDADRFLQAETIAKPALETAHADVALHGFVEAVCSVAEEESRLPLLWIGLGVLGLLCVGALAATMLGSKQRSAASTNDFDKRRVVLRDWAAELRAPVTELQAPVAATRSDALARMYNEALAVARESESAIANAKTEPELDRIEIRIARAWMQLRDIRNTIRT